MKIVETQNKATKAKTEKKIDTYILSRLAAGWTLEQIQAKVWLYWGLLTVIRKDIYYRPMLGVEAYALYRRSV
jgi:hypothetical protein